MVLRPFAIWCDRFHSPPHQSVGKMQHLPLLGQRVQTAIANPPWQSKFIYEYCFCYGFGLRLLVTSSHPSRFIVKILFRFSHWSVIEINCLAVVVVPVPVTIIISLMTLTSFTQKCTHESINEKNKEQKKICWNCESYKFQLDERTVV